MQEFLDPQNDYAFKRIFGNEEKPNVLRSFLNGALQLKGDKVIDNVAILHTHQAPHIKNTKETILDVRCHDQGGHEYIVEMQVMPQSHFDQRVLYYASKAYSLQLDRGIAYKNLRKVIFLGVLGFEFGDNKDTISTHHILDVETQKHLIQDFKFVFVQLPKFKKKEEELDNMKDKWIFFLKHAKKLKSIPKQLQDPDIIEAFEIAKRCNWSRDELLAYEYRRMAEWDAEARVDFAHKKGKAETQIEIAQNFIAKGFDLSIIADATNLSLEKVEELADVETES